MMFTVPASHHSRVRRPTVMCRHATHQVEKEEERNARHTCRSFVFLGTEGGPVRDDGAALYRLQLFVSFSGNQKRKLQPVCNVRLLTLSSPSPALQTCQLFTRILPSSHTKAHPAATRNNDECGVRGNDHSHLAADRAGLRSRKQHFSPPRTSLDVRPPHTPPNKQTVLN